jgi:hypothetical protein
MRDLLVNDVLKCTDSEHTYRILWVSDDRKIVYLFNMNTLEMPAVVQYSELHNQIEVGEFGFQDPAPYLTSIAEENLSKKEKTFRDDIWHLMSEVVCGEPNIFDKHERGKIISEIAAQTGKDRKIFYQYLKIYWQRGKTKNAFLPDYQNCGGSGKERKANTLKRGRPRKYGENIGVNVDEATKKIFEQAIKKYYHTRNEYTLKDTYILMIKEHYTKYTTQTDGNTKAELIFENKIPSIDQFRYWYNKKHNVKEKISKRKGTRKFELDHRAVLGKSDYGIMGPGAKYQIDATVGDIYLVSRFNRSEIIGRPVIYFVIDVFSRMVTGMYVGLEGPSWAGSMMAIANAAANKVKYCAEYGIEITEEEWPCRHLPNTILADRGEMEGYSVETLINALNVRVENAQPYRADVKGIVERFFKTINDTTVHFLPGHIKSDAAQRGGEDYRLNAKFDIRQFAEMLIHYVLYHNNHNFLESYERTADMIADDVEPIPIKMWEWGIARFGALRSFPEETVKLCLMPSDTALVTKKGIHFNGLYYVCDRAAKELWFETARAKGSFNVNISYDPRNMSSIYIREGKNFEKCFLAEWQDKYVDMCFDEIKYLQAKEKLAQQKNAPKKLTEKIDFLVAIDNVIAKAEEMARQTAIPKSKSARTKNIRENRRNEKELNRHEESFVLGSNAPLSETAKNVNDGISPDMRMIMEDLEERLNEK